MKAFQTCLVFALLAVTSLGAVPKSHAGHNHGGQGERVGDGAGSPHAHSKSGDAHPNAFDHEAILGSHAEAEEFDNLPPEEAKKRLRVLLTKMDRNDDQVIERQELYSWILRSFRALSQEESGERFADADTNEDGKVTWSEYVFEEFHDGDDEAVEGQDQEEIIRLDPDRTEELHMLEEDKMLFNAADKNKDGWLNKDEFVSFSHPEDDEEMHEYVITQVLKDKDANNDGEVDFQEYMGDRGKDHTKEWLVGEKDRFDSELDKDKDGVLNKEEIKAWMIPSNDEIAKDEVEHLFAGADDDVDGKLSFDEVVEHHDIFVGSEATDYGEHLNNIHKFSDEL